MKVLYFSGDYSPHDERFLTALAASAHEVQFLRLNPSHAVTLPGGVHEVGQGELPGSLPDTQSQVDALKRLFDKIHPDLVHAGPLHGPAYLAALAGIEPLVSMSWGADILHDAIVNRESLQRILTTLERSTVFVGDCQAVADAAAGYGFSPERIFLFPWGVDLSHFHPHGNAPLREQLGWRDEFVFLSNRSFEPIYGVDVVVEAFTIAARQNPALRLLVYGKGSLETCLREKAAAAEISQLIHFGGYVSRQDLPATYRSADVFVSASHCDGSSVSLMEALACARPALVSDIPGNREWVTDGEQGWIFEDGNASELAEKMLAASSEPRLGSMGKKARRLAEKRADWQKNIPVLLQAYETAARLKTPAGLKKVNAR